MEIRKAREEDLPAIIELMKSSLGESRIPKSPKLWRWKHEENPFGKSYVLLAEENNEIIGLRTFMQWKWIWKGKTYRAVRAVDTATHPSHQGKGIFKKLTLQQAEICRNEGIDFVFNTPNDSSRPGYLKMGWVLQEKMPLKFKILRPVSLAYSKIFDKTKYADILEDPSPKQEWNNAVLSLFDEFKQTYDKQLTNPITKDYIIWRYVNNPLYRYNYFTDNKNYVLISRIKLHSFAKELRITEFILLNPVAQNLSSAINKQVKKFCSDNDIDFISLSGPQYKLHQKHLSWMGVLPVMAVGPLMTIKDLNVTDEMPELLKSENWNYSIGDNEIF